jgi:hypothetical protein
MASTLTASARYISGLPPERLLAALRTAVEPQDGGFQFVSKLSGGGVVIRVLRAPKTERDWFGTIEEDRFSIAMIATDGSGTPFQPILRGEVGAQDGGSLIALELAAHPDARAFSVLFVIGGLLLGAASLLALAQSTLTGVVGLAFAALFLAFPGFRARVGFDHACEASLDAFERQLDLQSRQLSKRRVR